MHSSKVLVSSSKQMSNLWSNQEWTDHLEEFGIETNWFPVFADLANIFIAKSQFYVSWKPSFKKAQGYPKMVAWLNNDSGCDSDSELLLELDYVICHMVDLACREWHCMCLALYVSLGWQLHKYNIS